MPKKGKKIQVPDPFSKYYTDLQNLQKQLSQKRKGSPEAQLEPLVRDLLLSWEEGTEVEREVRISGGRIDLAVKKDGLHVGFVEVKAPGKPLPPYDKSHNPHDREQWEQFKELPNLLYTNGSEFALFRSGEKRREAKLPDYENLKILLTDFFNWQPITPKNPRDLAEFLAPITRFLREDVLKALEEERLQKPQDEEEEIDQPFNRLKEEWSRAFFQGADGEQVLSDKVFADAYAQLMVYGFLLAQMDRPQKGWSSLEEVLDTLQGEYGVLMEALFASNHPRLLRSIRSSYDLLRRAIAAVDPGVLKPHGEEDRDPWLYFYEDFLAAYDPEMRRDMGVYYTPVEVVQAMVAMVDHLLKTKLKREGGLANEKVTILDPAVGTGTFLLGILDRAMKNVSEDGPGMQSLKATELAKRAYAFEIMIGPYAVAQLRFSRAIKGYGGTLPKGGLRIYLADTLEAPTAPPLVETLFLERLAIERRKAARVKKEKPILVCIGNPPYDRVEAETKEERRAKGGWILEPRGKNGPTLLDDFIEPLKKLNYGVHAKNLYNLYVYFWRWALWKVFESEKSPEQGVVAFITPSSFLSGPGFAGMRAHMRRLLDEIYILDLGGQGRLPGFEEDENVFNIQTPVCITLGLRYGTKEKDALAKVFYHKAPVGKREEKMRFLKEIASKPNLLDTFEEVQGGPYDPFVPGPKGVYAQWPKITDLFPWQHSGVEFKRTWPIGPTEDVLRERWKRLLNEPPDTRGKLFREGTDRNVNEEYKAILSQEKLHPISKLNPNDSPEDIRRYSYRPLDRAWAIVDGRVCSRPRPVLWHIQGEKQIYLASRLTASLGRGPALMASVYVPDRHSFSGGAKDIIPLYRDREGTEPNITGGLLDRLGEVYGTPVSPEDFLAYVYAVLAHPGFTERFKENLSSPPVRVPITKDPELFRKAVDLGKRLLCCHTFGERYKELCSLPKGPRLESPMEGYPTDYSYKDGVLMVGTMKVVPVEEAVWEYEVGGYKVLRRWLDFRIKGPGKASSPLDKIKPQTWDVALSEELLDVIRAITCSLEIHKEQNVLLEEILKEDTFGEEELPKPSPDEKKPPLYEMEVEEDLKTQSAQPVLLTLTDTKAP